MPPGASAPARAEYSRALQRPAVHSGPQRHIDEPLATLVNPAGRIGIRFWAAHSVQNSALVGKPIPCGAPWNIDRWTCPVDEPREDESAGGVDKSAPATVIGRRFRADLGELPAADNYPDVGRGRPPVPSISVPFLMTRISSAGELMVVSKSVRNL